MNAVNVAAGSEVFTSNAFLVTGRRSVLVDAGAAPGVVEEVRSHSGDLDAVVLTHLHRDHVAQLESVVEAFGAEVYCHGDHPLRTGRLSNGDRVTAGGGELKAVHVPGHSDDHLAFFGENAVFTGDLVVYEDSAFTGGSFGRTDLAGGSRELLIGSLEMLLEIIPDTAEHLYPGHGPEFHGDVRGLIGAALERAERRNPKYR
ncbi:MAG: Hydroxyacylglutathione hydrolase [Methanonatronarchaeales archaeon]|nr:Hydroxyacylglutathione hydrolase [Methanonatronarchaeales archaeon]